MRNTDWRQRWMFKSRSRSHRIGIKNNEICSLAHSKLTPIGNIEPPRGKTAHLVDRFLKSQQLALAHKMTQHARKTPKTPRMRMRNIKNAITGNHHTRMSGCTRHGLRGDFGINLPGKNNGMIFALLKNQIVGKIFKRYICPIREIAQTFSRVLARASVTHNLIAAPEPCLEFSDGLSANLWVFKTCVDLIRATDLKFHGQHHV